MLVILAASQYSFDGARNPCVPASSAQGEIDRVREIVSETFDSTQPLSGTGDGVRTAEQVRLRDSLLHDSRLHDSLPSVPPSAVMVVKDKAVCSAALVAINREYEALVARGAPPWTVRAVLVLRIGDVYVVEDPLDARDEWRAMFVFTHDFSRLKVYFGV